MKKNYVIAMLLVMVLMITGCTSTSEIDRLERKIDKADSTIEELEEELEDAEKALEDALDLVEMSEESMDALEVAKQALEESNELLAEAEDRADRAESDLETANQQITELLKTSADTPSGDSQLVVEQSYFFVREAGEVEIVSSNVFEQGTEIFLQAQGISGFEVQDGKVHIEANVILTNIDGVEVLRFDGLLNESGIVDAPEGFIEGLYGFIERTSEIETGKYIFNFEIEDLIANTVTTISKEFILE